MESLENTLKRVNELVGKRYRYRRKDYKVLKVTCRLGRFVVKTDSNWFVFDAGQQIEGFLSEIQELVEKENEQQNNTIMSSEVTVIDQSVSHTDSMSAKLMEMFETLSGNPTDADYKKAEAMCKVVHTVVSVEQTKLNYMKLKDKMQ